jgi:TRAP-type mannitol/chloroaromatic compound transport system permease large subunit
MREGEREGGRIDNIQFYLISSIIFFFLSFFLSFFEEETK